MNANKKIVRIRWKRRILLALAGSFFGSFFTLLLVGLGLNGPLLLARIAQILVLISGVVIFVVPVLFGSAIGHLHSMIQLGLLILNTLLWAYLFNVIDIGIAHYRNSIAIRRKEHADNKSDIPGVPK